MNAFLAKITAVCLMLGVLPAAHAQKIYTLNWRTELALSGVGLGAGLAGLAIARNVEPLSAAEIALLDRKQVWSIDRQSTHWLSDKADDASNFFFYGSPIIPALLFTDRSARKQGREIPLLYLEALTLTGGITQLTKILTLRSRPYTYNADFPLERKQKKVARESFFSGHTSFSAASCFFTARVWSDLHPDSRWKPAVWAAAAGIPALTGYLRMRAGRHYLTDVATGYAVGAALGWLVPVLHKNAAYQKSGLRIQGTSQGAGLVWNFTGSASKPGNPRHPN